MIDLSFSFHVKSGDGRYYYARIILHVSTPGFEQIPNSFFSSSSELPASYELYSRW